MEAAILGAKKKGVTNQMGVSKNRGTPKWMVYNGNPIKIDDLGVPLFLETPKCVKKMKYRLLYLHLSWIGSPSFVPCIISFWLKRFYLFFSDPNMNEFLYVIYIGLFPVLRRCPLGIFSISPKTGPSQVTSCVL